MIKQWGYSDKAGGSNPIKYPIEFKYVIYKSYNNRYYGVNEFFGLSNDTLTSLTQIAMENAVSTTRSWYWSTIGY